MNRPLIKFGKSKRKAGLIRYSLVCSTLMLTSCFENPSPPQLTTLEIEEIEATIVTSGGKIISDGGSEIFQKGVCVSLNDKPTVQDQYTIDGYGNGDFTSILILDPDQTYYIRAYAVNGAGIGYGDLQFITLEPLPNTDVVIVDFGNITGNSAFMRGRVESNHAIISRGACWSTSMNPTIDHDKTEAGSGNGIFETILSNLIPGTTYYTRAYATSESEVFYSDDYQFTTVEVPQVTTRTINNEGTFVISTGGIIYSGGLISSAGVCWSTSPGPTIEDDKTEDQLIYSDFYSDPYGLLPGETYYVRAYAVNIAGVGYGNEFMVTMPEATVYDPDGNPYSSVDIGSQTWLVENLKSTKYANGEAIQNLTSLEDWANAASGAWCFYENESQFNIPYGRLYNWFSVTDPRNVCPSGWHVPDESEWSELISFLGGNEVAGNALKETGIAHWQPNNDFATNSSGFTALPGGARSTSMGISYPIPSLGLFWSTTPVDSENAVGYYLFDAYQSITPQGYEKQTGLSVRCVKD
jgi:uncharacterized protein (TIGR02145 family)